MPAEEPRRSIGLGTAVAVIAGEVVGIGIFLTPARMIKTLGSPMLVLAVWLAMGATAFCGALCYGELAARFPEAGGGYVYLREAYGRGFAFLYGWNCLLVMDPGLSAALASGLAAYLVALVPALPAKGVAIAAILCAAVANSLGLRLAGGLARVLTVAKIGLLALIVLWGFGARLGDASRLFSSTHQAASGSLVGALAGAVIGAFFSFGGWWDVGKLAGEIREPQRTLPRALAWGVALVTATYIATSAVFSYLVPLEQAGNDETFVAQAGAVLFGSRGSEVLSAIVILCVATSLLAFTAAAPRVYYAMSRDGIGVGALGQLNARTGAPVRAIAVQAALACVLVALARFDQILGYFIFVTVALLACSVAGLFKLRRRGGPAPTYRTPAFPATAFAFLGMTVVVLALLAAGTPVQSALGVAVTLLGIPVYAWLQKGEPDHGLDQNDSLHRGGRRPASGARRPARSLSQGVHARPRGRRQHQHRLDAHVDPGRALPRILDLRRPDVARPAAVAAPTRDDHHEGFGAQQVPVLKGISRRVSA